MRYSVRVTPNSSQNQITELADGSLKIKLMAKAINGSANEALIELLADYFHIKKYHIQIVKGESSRQKIINVDEHSNKI